MPTRSSAPPVRGLGARGRGTPRPGGAAGLGRHAGHPTGTHSVHRLPGRCDRVAGQRRPAPQQRRQRPQGERMGRSARGSVAARTQAPAGAGAEPRTSCTRRCDGPIHGVGPLPAAAVGADRSSRSGAATSSGRSHEVIEQHVRLAGAQGFATNLGGLVTAAVTMPAEHRGAGPDPVPDGRRHRPPAGLRPRGQAGPQRDPGLHPRRGRRSRSLVRKKKIPAPPMAIATAPAYDPHLDHVIAGRGDLRAADRVAGKRRRRRWADGCR